ncbi:MAG: class I SAM-dependent methyltransferase [Xanthobacteraceae bacterium]
MLDHAAQSGRHSLAERGPDFYATPAEAVRALLRVETLPRRIWEPAAGGCAIATVLRAAGHYVHAADLYDWHCPNCRTGVDFLKEVQAPAGTAAIVTNPPYAHSEEFVAHALELCPLVVMLLRLAFLESERRSPLLDRGQLARVHVFKNRLPMMHRHGWQGPRASSAIAFAWFVFDRNHQGPTTLNRMRSR